MASLAVAFAVALSAAKAQQIGTDSPDFALIDTSGELLTLSELQGTPVMLNFWASWCPPCLAELPLFQQIHDEVNAEEQRLAIVLVNNNEDTEAARRFLDDLDISLTAVFDGTSSERRLLEDKEPDTTFDVIRRFRVRAMPTTMFIDEGGVVRAIKLGELLPREAPSFLQAIGIEWAP